MCDFASPIDLKFLQHDEYMASKNISKFLANNLFNLYVDVSIFIKFCAEKLNSEFLD